MPRIKKKGQAGAAKNYLTRNQAIRKLQVSLPDFRQLCIWKGIYPREPRSKKKVSKSSTASTTFYYAKDIQYLLHEPLLQKFRDQKVLEKKISKALGRGDVGDAQRLEGNASRPDKTGKPRYTLDHVVRERYPTFVDALRDLDDCLSMLFLFANLPSTSSVPAKMIARCEKLCLEFQHYLIVSKSVTKSFLSIKGIYYQANIQGEQVLWLVPYKFNQRIVGDVDFRIMGTFVEFYMTLLSFVNFRLYTSVGLKYPPKFDAAKDANAAELGAFTLEGKTLVGTEEEKKTEKASSHEVDPKTQAAVNKVLKTIKAGTEEAAVGKDVEAGVSAADDEDQTNSGAIDKFEPVAPGGDVLFQPDASANDHAKLFSNCTFYLSRETPRQSLEFLLKAFGCKRVGWDPVLGDGAFTTNELDPNITHQIVDRPPIEAVAEGSDADEEDNQTSQKLPVNSRVPGRIYVQPQWVWDCINDVELKEPHLYAPGAALPPHLSPFVRNVQGAYDPTVPLEDQEPEAEALEADEDADETVEGMDVDEDEQDDDEEGDEDEDEEEDDGADQMDVEVDDDESADEDALRQQELEAELTGAPVKSKATNVKAKAKDQARKALSKKAKEEAEDLERAKGMLSKKKRKLYEQMIYTNNKKSAEDQKLRSKRRKLEKEKAKTKGKA
ncbi:mRNA-binding ribosome synthesis protein nop7 [Claviceps purpurea]|nr:mRNA-binding ribosome synthesis protein nop7 [Claviceps purpurea]KAG6183402.1 mRNA-binding ribosome synthesis protein nop7 [Claviceps purpurea]KAG6212099.1 mRNA-binding ribosome synthesis protein nop7 [Claviceps purpurea]KAG6253012.1 mRNA-binding ribosome synthesis protein nop7 [Claviceps purpurea]KAG6304533.1 mRNA-binding ribosome synthesis protein nop7 [Claviceps purpurea]